MNINQIIESAKVHRARDDYARGTFGQLVNGRFRGCSVGCTIHDIDPTADTTSHAFLAEKLGVPEALIHLQDYFFEHLEDNRDWTVDFLSAIPTTPANVIPRFLLEIVPVVDAAYYRLTKDFLEDWARTGQPDLAAGKRAERAAEAAGEASAASAASASREAWQAIGAVVTARQAHKPERIREMSETLLNIMRGK